MNYTQLIKEELTQSADVLQQFMAEEKNLLQIGQVASLMAQAVNNGKKIISCGNGGSHCDAMHFAEELSGRYRDHRRSLPAIAISDVSHITCTGNDYGFEYIFSRFVEGLGQPGDVLLGISTSGNSANVIRAVEKAKEKGMAAVVLTGKDGGKLSSLADVEIRVPYQGYADRIQEVHIKIIHVLILLIEKMTKVK
jgi:D-sedoheptulose 7-phosphate isomerase